MKSSSMPLWLRAAFALTAAILVVVLLVVGDGESRESGATGAPDSSPQGRPPRISAESVADANPDLSATTKPAIRPEQTESQTDPHHRPESAEVGLREQGTSATIRGRVVRYESGAVVPGVRLWLVPGTRNGASTTLLSAWKQPERTTTSDLSGEFELRKVAFGAWVVGIAPSEPVGPETWVAIAKSVQLSADTAEAWVELPASCGTFLRVSVLDSGGDQVFAPAGATGGPFDLVHGPSSLEFRPCKVGPLFPGSYTVSVLGHGSRGSELRATAPSDVELVLKPTAAVRIRIVDPGRAGTCLTRVLVMRRGPRLVDDMETDTGTTMLEHLVELTTGTYDVVVSTADGRAAHRVLEVVGGRNEELEVALEPAARLRVENAAAATLRIEIRRGEERVSRDLLSAAAATILVVPPGRLEVVEMRSDGPRSRFVSTFAGYTADVLVGN